MKLSNIFLEKLASFIEANYIEEVVLDEFVAEKSVEVKPQKKNLFSKFAKGDKMSACESFEDSEVPCGSAPPPMMGMAMASMAAPAAPRSLDEVVANLDKTFMELVFSFADNKGLSDVDLQKRGNIDRKAFSKLRCGTTKKPSKSTAMALAIALELNLDETKDLLSRAGYALSPCSKQDLIVQYFIENEAYDIYALNEVLSEYGESELGVKI
jgi:transcriptional regulator with XRE-family HTH domain